MKVKNAIILAGGNGTRLLPLTNVVSKHLISVNGKFIIDYPIQTLVQMGVKNLTVVLGGNHFSQIVDHLKDGSSLGMKINYVYQGEPRGIAQAINLCEKQVFDGDQFAVILGDNVFSDPITWDERYADGAQAVLYKHPELRRFGVASVLHTDMTNKIAKIREKPQVLEPEYDHYAITGCYLFDQRFFQFFGNLKPSHRQEYEITDILQQYLDAGDLHCISQQKYWSDAGTHESIRAANQYFYGQEQQ